MLGEFMNYLILVNRDNKLDKDYVPMDLVNSNSLYKDNILISRKVLEMFNKMKNDMKNIGYEIDIMSGYRDYYYQKVLYNNLVKEKGMNYAFKYIASPGASEHQTGLAIDICVYKNDKCYIEHELLEMEEIKYIQNNCYKYGFILRYPEYKEEITGYNYEGWHFRYVGNYASYIYFNSITLEEFFKRLVNKR